MLAHSRTRFWLQTLESLEALSHSLYLSACSPPPSVPVYKMDPNSCPQGAWLQKTGFQMLEAQVLCLSLSLEQSEVTFAGNSNLPIVLARSPESSILPPMQV